MISRKTENEVLSVHLRIEFYSVFVEAILNAVVKLANP